LREVRVREDGAKLTLGGAASVVGTMGAGAILAVVEGLRLRRISAMERRFAVSVSGRSARGELGEGFCSAWMRLLAAAIT
jgi:hypothetical protein